MQNDSRTNVFIHNVGKQRSSWRVISHTILPWQFFLLWFKKLQAMEKVPFESVLNVKYKIHFCTTLIQMPEFWAKLSIWPKLHELCLSKQLSLELEVLLMHIINIFFRKRQPLFLCDCVVWHPQTSWLELFVRCIGAWVLYTRAIGWEYRILEREETVEFFRQHEKIKRIRDNCYRNATSAAIVAIIRWIHDHQIQPLELILLMLLVVSEKTVELSYLYRWISYGTFSVWLLQRKMQLCAKYTFSFSSMFDYWQQSLISLLMLGVFLQENFRSLIFGISFPVL